ncbi:MAG: sensor histidine kinase, partial [Ktedonobacterales bacterium]
RPLPTALMDAGRARQVTRNLISNAIKYTPQGGHVVVSVSANAKYVSLRVQDDGVGIAEEALARVWERSYRAPQVPGEKREPGQGLGLAIVRIIVEAHHGVKSLESQPGKGSVFTVGFPRADQVWLR